MLLSIVLPVCDVRTAGLRGLESALAQRRDDGRVEVVGVAGRDLEPAGEALLAQCDKAVRLPLDADDPGNEIAFHAAGARAASGELLFFAEGHTVLEPDAAARILAHFTATSDAELAWAPRHNRGETALGALIGRHNFTHEKRAAAHGTFTLGANSVIRRSLFERLGGLDPRFLRYSEFMLYERVRAARVAIHRIAAPLCTHHNDMPVARWGALIRSNGAGRRRYYQTLRAAVSGAPVAIRHPIFAVADHAAAALLFGPVARCSGALAVRSAIALGRAIPDLAYRIFVLATGLTDLAGYCAEARRTRRVPREVPAPATASAARSARR